MRSTPDLIAGLVSTPAVRALSPREQGALILASEGWWDRHEIVESWFEESDEAQAVLDRVPEIEALAVNNEKERETRYKEAVRSCELDSVISLLKCLHIRNEQRAQAGKKATSVDERYGKMAEHNLNAELAFVLEKDKQEIKDIIHDML